MSGTLAREGRSRLSERYVRLTGHRPAAGDKRHMMRKILVVAAFLSAAVLAGCDGGVFATGRVVDVKRQPISGARILLSRGEHSREFKATTTDTGCFNLGGTVAPGKY